MMAPDSPMTYDAFLCLAREAGLDTTSVTAEAHMDELYSYVNSVLASLRALDALNCSQAEPDMAFLPERD